MNLIKQWKDERNYTFQFMADLLDSSVGYMQRVYAGKQKLGPEHTKNLKTIMRLEHLIDGAPNDVILLKYELAQFVGLSVEELEKGKERAERKIELEALKSLPKEPTDLRKVKLEFLENLRENGYKSAYRPNVSYDAQEVDAEIARKTFNKKRKKEIWEQKMAVRV